MNIRDIHPLRRGAVLGLLLILPFIAPAQKADSKAINELLKVAEDHAILANNDAETLESYTRASSISRQSHAQRLSGIKEHANNLIEDFNQLNSLRGEASPWQQEAIDRVNPLLQEIATHLTNTINHFNDNKQRLNMPAFRDYVKANHEYMNKASRLISDFVEYGETKAKANALEATLELPATAQTVND